MKNVSRGFGVLTAKQSVSVANCSALLELIIDRLLKTVCVFTCIYKFWHLIVEFTIASPRADSINCIEVCKDVEDDIILYQFC
jgi:hypothetical protein